ncbi:MAG: ABC transporter permease subunit, partial [Thermaerobacterales bacterium]
MIRSRRRWVERGALALLAAWLWPLWPLALWSVADRWPVGDLWPVWSLSAWQDVVIWPSRLPEALAVSAGIALAVTGLVMVMALPAAWALSARGGGPGWAWSMLLLPFFIPTQTAAYGLHRFFLQFGFTDTAGPVIVVHLLPALPYAVVILTLTGRYWGRAREQQAISLGASPWQTFWRITLPGWMPGIINACFLAFLVSWGQYLLTTLMGGGRVIGWPALMVAFHQGGRTPLVAGVALL